MDCLTHFKQSISSFGEISNTASHQDLTSSYLKSYNSMTSHPQGYEKTSESRENGGNTDIRGCFTDPVYPTFSQMEVCHDSTSSRGPGVVVGQRTSDVERSDESLPLESNGRNEVASSSRNTTTELDTQLPNMGSSLTHPVESWDSRNLDSRPQQSSSVEGVGCMNTSNTSASGGSTAMSPMSGNTSNSGMSSTTHGMDRNFTGGFGTSGMSQIGGSRMNACPQSYNSHMGLMAAAAAAQGYDMSGYNSNPFMSQSHASVAGLAAQRHMIGSQSASGSLIPLAPPNSYMSMRNGSRSGGYGAGSMVGPNTAAYSLLPSPNSMGSSAQFYYDYSSLSRHQQAAAAAAAAVNFQRAKDSYGAFSLPPAQSGPSASMSHTQGQSHMQSQVCSRSDTNSTAPFTAPMPVDGSGNPTPTQGMSIPQTSSGPVKRPRGRPRKHPLPVPQHLQQMYKTGGSIISNEGVPAAQDVGTVSSLSIAVSNASTGAVVMGSGNNKETSTESISRKRISRAARCLDTLKSLFSSYSLSQLQQLSSAPPQLEVAEEYIAIGGPFTRIAVAVDTQTEQQTDYIDDNKKISDNANVATLVDDLVARQQQKAQARLSVVLNKSFVWSSLDSRVPVRDLTVARNHIAALLNDSRVFVYRHKTHPLVRSRVDTWEHIEALDNRGIVAVRVASALLPDNWRESYFESQRPSIIQNIRKQLNENGVELPAHDPENPYKVSPEELKVMVAEHPDGILCSPTHVADPDWMPDPFVVAALDQAGTVRVAKCSGFFNYPMVVKVAPNTTPELAVKDQQQPQQRQEGLINEAAFRDEPIEGNDLQEATNHAKQSEEMSPESTNAATTDADTAKPTEATYRIEYKPVCLDRLEKQQELSVLTKDESGQSVKVRAQIQDVALGELTTESFLPNGGLEAAMVFYALGGKNEHSAFIKGRNLYLRFKNFPAGPAKLLCGPLGYSGAFLLANGTVWIWTAQSCTKAGGGPGKVGVSMNQVAGSLAGRTVVDLVALGADLVALTSDGVVHEWNIYSPYLNANSGLTETVAPLALTRPSIPEPIEWTPDFQRKILSNVRRTQVDYKVGNFSWQASERVTSPDTEVTKAASSDLCHKSSRNEQQTTESAKQTAMTDANGEERNLEADDSKDTEWNYKSEEELEWYRQAEIKERYLSSVDPATNATDPIERVFLTEGVTIFLKATSGRFSYVPNDLASYRSARGSVFTSSMTGETSMTIRHAELLIRQFGDMGKPLLTNPVVVARMKLPRDLTDEQLRNQLELMAVNNPAPYRLLVSPISIVVAVLRRLDLTEETRRMLLTRVPVPIAAFDPKLYLEALTGLSPSILDKEMVARKRLGEESWASAGESSDGPTREDPIPERKIGVPRKSRGRVGRPRGSRAGVRATLSTRPPSLGMEKTATSSVEPMTVNATTETTVDALRGSTTSEESGGQELNGTEGTVSTATTTSAAQASSSLGMLTRKRNRRHSAALDDEQFYTGFADSEDSDKAWEQIMQMLDDEEDSEETDSKKRRRKSKGKKRGRMTELDDQQQQQINDNLYIRSSDINMDNIQEIQGADRTQFIEEHPPRLRDQEELLSQHPSESEVYSSYRQTQRQQQFPTSIISHPLSKQPTLDPEPLVPAHPLHVNTSANTTSVYNPSGNGIAIKSNLLLSEGAKLSHASLNTPGNVNDSTSLQFDASSSFMKHEAGGEENSLINNKDTNVQGIY